MGENGAPASGGRDAKGRDGTPSKDYLFNAENNIELGVAYLDVLDDNYLKNIQNKVSREYCVISAYNAGAGGTLPTACAPTKHAIICQKWWITVGSLYRYRQIGSPCCLNNCQRKLRSLNQ